MSVTDLADAELVALVAAGQMGGLDELYRRHAGAARRQAHRLVGCHADADDLVADTFLAVLTSIQRGYRPENFPAYLVGTLHNCQVNRIRTQRRCRAVGLLENRDHDSTRVDATEWILDPADLLDVHIDPTEVDTIRRAFRLQPSRSRLAMWLRCVEEQTSVQIAHQLGITPTAVRMLLARARRAMRRTYLVLDGADQRAPRTPAA